MLRTGICMIGFALGLGVLLPRLDGVIIAIIVLIVCGMSLVCVAPIQPTVPRNNADSQPKPTDQVRRSKSRPRHSAVLRQRDAEEADLDNAWQFPSQSGP